MAFRQLARNAMLVAARRLGINLCLRIALRRRLLVLCYHAVIPDDHPQDSWRARVATRVSDFRRQLEILNRFCNPVSATDVLDHVRGGTDLPDSAVLVTFDDGFRNNLTQAAPELKRQGIPAIIHVTTDHVGSESLLWPQELDERVLSWKQSKLPMPSDEPDVTFPRSRAERWALAHRIRGTCKRLPHNERTAYLDRLRAERCSIPEEWQELYSFLSWDEVRQLDREGFEIGSHTVHHPILTTLPPTQLATELTESRARIERELNKPCPWIAYPNGGDQDVSSEVILAAHQAGYEVAFTLRDRPNPMTLSPLEIDRTCIPGTLSENAFQARVNGFLSLLAR